MYKYNKTQKRSEAQYLYTHMQRCEQYKN